MMGLYIGGERARPISNLARVSGSSVDTGGTKLVLNTKTFSSADGHLRQQVNQTRKPPTHQPPTPKP